MSIPFACPSCGAETKVPVEFQGHSVECPACGAACRPARARCPYCAEDISAFARFCRFCRTNLQTLAPTPPAPYCEWEDRNFGLWTAYWKTCWNSIAHPDAFFARMPRETGGGPPFRYMLMTAYQLWALSALPLIAAGILLSVFPLEGLPAWLGAAVLSGAGAYTLLLPLFTWTCLHILSAIYHLSARACGGRGTYSDTRRVVAYTTGAAFLCLLPYMGSMAFMAAHLIMCVYGFKHLHQISIPRSVVAFVLPGIAFALILLAGLVGFVFLLL